MIKNLKLLTYLSTCSSWREDKDGVTSEVHPGVWKLLQCRQLSFPPSIKVSIIYAMYYVSSSVTEEDVSPPAQPWLTWGPDL